MQQLEIEFFWPLTEQIPLELDYSECVDSKSEYEGTFNPYVISGNGITTYVTGGTGGTFTITGQTQIDLSQGFYFKYVDEPPWYRKIILKLIGLKWRH